MTVQEYRRQRREMDRPRVLAKELAAAKAERAESAPFVAGGSGQ